jgi:hypothetical protein
MNIEKYPEKMCGITIISQSVRGFCRENGFGPFDFHKENFAAYKKVKTQFPNKHFGISISRELNKPMVDVYFHFYSFISLVTSLSWRKIWNER